LLAKERLHRYGTKAYAKMRGVEWTQEFHQRMCKKYGEKFADIKPVRYGVTKWKMVLQKHGDVTQMREVTVDSALHQQPDLERDVLEAEKAAQAEMRESGWVVVDVEYLGRKYVYHYEPTRQQKLTEIELPKKAAEEIEEVITEKIKETVKETLQEKRISIAKAMKAAGYSAKEVAQALMEI